MRLLVAGSGSPRRGRLTRSADFDRVMRSGRSHAGRELVLYVFPRGDAEAPRLGLSVSRKVGGAVQRNLVKRLVRESFGRLSDDLPAGTDVVVIARAGARELAEREGLDGIHGALSSLIASAGAGSGSGSGARPGARRAGQVDEFDEVGGSSGVRS